MSGAGRDLYTGDDVVSPHVLGEDQVRALLSPDRVLAHVEGPRHGDALAALAGLRPGGQLRKAIAGRVPGDAPDTALLHRLLDDVSTASFVSTHAWAAWAPGWVEKYRAAGLADRIDRDVTDVCVGFRAGSAALAANGRSSVGRMTQLVAPPPLRSDDPYSWHQLEPDIGPNQRRTRRMDLWSEGGLLHVNADFQDSAAVPDAQGDRMIFHEYRIEATLEPQDLVLQAISVTPGVLPFGECVAGVKSAQGLVGRPVVGFHSLISATLQGSAGCTHLNDMMRALRDVVAMRDRLMEATADGG
ncbi:MAG: DUF2889 domain-containing protein [Phenylobacterium sp.]|uniref:DUF2889 domain-containing protein n=1 Tax=Phenylobacterium sp. TaxID=1871053 RepID=UPI0027360C46|nr:DUF2889 domain-containing protein [Phenylobacterium sp.]MDP3750030.1 DUF2889 domain-containing protein [Phenylobacterium sp.]